MFWAKRRCTFAAEAFSKSRSNADLVLTYNPAVDEPLDKPNLLRLTFDWGQAQERSANDNVESARVGDATHRWASYEDRVVHQMVLANRSAAESLHFQLSGRGFVWNRLNNGGYAVFDVAFERFIIDGPSVTDATAKAPGGVVNWNYPDANISIDSAFLNVAQYPITVTTPIEYAMLRC